METASKDLNVALLRFNVRSPADLDGAFAAIAKENVDALAVIEDIVLIQNHKRIAQSAIKQRPPSISFIEYPDEGGLFGYCANYLALYRRAAFFVDRILKGTKPAGLPIKRPTKFEFVINMKTAKAIDLAIPAATGLRADRTIE